MAFAKHPTRTLILQIGAHRAVSDLVERHVVKFSGDAPSRNDLRARLLTAGCALKAVGSDWLKAGQVEIDRAIDL